MADIKLSARTGRIQGSASSRRLRHDGQIPAVVYGHGIDPTAVSVEARALRAALSTKSGLNAVLELTVDDAPHLAMARDIQRHPVRGTVSHVDFLVVNRDEVVSVEVPLTLIGESHEVHVAGGVVDHLLFSLTIEARPGQIPDVIQVDVSQMVIGDAIRVGDLSLPDGVSTEVDPESAVAVAHIPEAEEAPEAPADDAAEGAAGASAGGA